MRTLFLLLLIFPCPAFAHDVAQHLDPELLTGWQTWLHLTIQWTHLVAFALWLGLTAGVLLLGMEPRLDHLLYGSWILFLVFLATGTYNMEWSAGISETPSVFSLPVLRRIPYGATYTFALAGKIGLYILSILLTLVITVLHVQRRVAEAKLRRIFLVLGATSAFLLTLAASIVLFYHEVTDLWPTRLHSLGGVIALEGPRGQTIVDPDVPPPNDFHLLAIRDAWIDIVLRWIHLLGFGLLLGGMVVTAFFESVSVKRFLWYSWILLIIQILSGIGNMARWTPFYPQPYLWNLLSLSHIRFGWSYVMLMAAKQTLVIAIVGLIIALTFRSLKFSYQDQVQSTMVFPRHYFVVGAALAFTIAYIMIILLLLHEGVDHAL